jgi:hypothetical protein
MPNDSHSHGTRQDVSNDTVSKNWEMTFVNGYLVPIDFVARVMFPIVEEEKPYFSPVGE